MLAATFTLTNCAQEIDNPNDVPSAGIPFEIVATSAETKTANSASVVSWVSGDALNVFHAEAGATEYVNDNNFTIAAEDLTSGRFTGTLTAALTADSYDWYAFYPYSSYIKTPANTSNGYTPIGAEAGVQQTQNGYDNMDHIAGENYPLYGVATGVASNVKPSFEMKHAYTIAKIVVKNTTDKELTVNTVSFTAPEAIVGTYYINFAGETLVYTGSGEKYVSNVANLTVSDGTALAKNAEATFYLAFKPFTAAAGSELKIAVNGYEKTLPLENSVTFDAGKIKTLNFSYDKVAKPEGTNVTWDLTKADHDSAEASEVVWKSDFVTMTLIKNSSSTAANNYLGGTNAHTRVYKDQILSLEPKASVTIQKIEFNVLSNYMDEFEGASWTNGNATTSGLVRTVVPTDESKTVSVTFSAATRFTSVKVYYTVDEDYVPPTLESIAVSGDYKTEFTQGSEFAFDGIVTAIYDNGETKNVTNDCEFTGYDLEQLGDQKVTVTYEGVTATYDIIVNEKQQGSIELKTFIVKSDDVVGDSAYQEYSKKIDGRGWIITCGGNNKSVGVNKSNRAKCTLTSYSKYAVSPVTTSSTASAFASTTSVSNVSKISYAALSGGSSHASTKIYVLYSADGTTFSQLTLTNGTQGATINTTAGGEFEFASCSGYFAVVFVATNTSGNWRLDDVNLTFTYSE